MAYTCNVCDKEFDHAGAKNLHERWCRLLRLEKEQKEAGVQPQPKQPKTCEHDWHMLGNSAVEKVARQNGYIKYCKKCEVVE